ncbi:glycoside hydrolase family 6 protein [Candidatus Parcubacteria bacterium]|nr:glycoside hydrolase family 6 protein [Candidatus Parcubacteria bacterium]
MFSLFSPLTLEWSFARASSVNVWWPESGKHMQGLQPFKAMVEGISTDQYEMYWQVDGGVRNHMDNNSKDYPHKEAAVDLNGWSWHGSGPYHVNFIAEQNGQTIAENSVDIYVDNGEPSVEVKSSVEPIKVETTIAEAKQPEVKVAVAPAKVTLQKSDISSSLYVSANSPAAKQAAEWRASRPNDAASMDVLAQTPSAQWLGSWSGDVEQTVAKVMNDAQGKTPVFIAYNIPGRDCGGYSAGGVASRDAYLQWIVSLTKGIGSNNAIVVLEPDALAGITCLDAQGQADRMLMLNTAMKTLKSNPGTKVYLDAGHAGWIDATTMATRLTQAGIAAADGFALNVSNFDSIDVENAFGGDLSNKLGGAHYIVDTSRNGNGSSGEWCNPSGRAIGKSPTFSTGNASIDAYLWLKTPGESDGNCNGGPNAGTWWPDYALSLVNNSH